MKIKRKDLIALCDRYEKLIDYLHALNRKQRKSKYNSLDERVKVLKDSIGFWGGISGIRSRLGIKIDEGRG